MRGHTMSERKSIPLEGWGIESTGGRLAWLWWIFEGTRKEAIDEALKAWYGNTDRRGWRRLRRNHSLNAVRVDLRKREDL